MNDNITGGTNNTAKIPSDTQPENIQVTSPQTDTSSLSDAQGSAYAAESADYARDLSQVPYSQRPFNVGGADISVNPYTSSTPQNNASDVNPYIKRVNNGSPYQQTGYAVPQNTGAFGSTAVQTPNYGAPQNAGSTVPHYTAAPQYNSPSAAPAMRYSTPPNSGRTNAAGTQGTPYTNTAQPTTSYAPNYTYAGSAAYENDPYARYYSPKYKERQQVLRASSLTGRLTLFIFLGMFIIAMIIMIIGIGSGAYDLSDVGGAYYGFTASGFYIYEGLTSLLSIAIPALIIAKVSHKQLDTLVPFKKVQGKTLAAVVFGGVAVCMLAQILSALFAANMSLFGIDVYANLESEINVSLFDFVMYTVCTAIIPALVEELAYRGVVVGLLKEHGDSFAILTSAIMFGVLHGNFAQIPFAFVVGLVLGFVRVKTDSMLPSMLIHFCNNFFAVVVTFAGELLPDVYYTCLEAMLMIILTVIGFISIAYLVRTDKNFFSVSGKNTFLTFREKVKTFFSSGFVIADMILLGIEAIMLLVPLTEVAGSLT